MSDKSKKTPIDEMRDGIEELHETISGYLKKYEHNPNSAYADGFADGVAKKWIPVEKRVPNESGYFLVTKKGFHENDGNIVSIRHFSKAYGFDANVLAWMKLPKAYEPER